MKSIRTVPAWAAVLAVLGSTAAAQDDPKALAEQILGAAKVPSGLCVHLGGVGELTAELTGGGRWLVHGLTPDAAALARARKAIAARGLYGTASVDRGRFDALPYTDNLVNLLVADDLDAALKAGLSLREVMRVLAPGGVAYLGQARQGALTEQALRARLAAGGIGTFRLVRQSGLWAEVVKPRPAEMDEWTHRAHDAAGTAVSQDTAIGPLTGPRWLAGPVWPMGTGYQVSNGGMVAAGGRIFNVTLNTVANAATVPQRRDRRWFLTARDAYNGLLLWSRPFGRAPGRDGQSLADGLLASGQRVYAVLGSKLLGLDAASGRTVRTYLDQPSLTGRLALADGALFLSDGKSLRAIDAQTGQVRWTHDAAAGDVLVDDGLVCYCTRRHAELVGLDAASGTTRWREKLDDLRGARKQLLFTGGGVIIFVWRVTFKVESDNGVAAFSTTDGRRLWRKVYDTPRAHWPTGVHFARGRIWIRRKDGSWHGLDPATGAPAAKITIQGGYCGGCTRDIATEQYLVSTRPPNLFSWADGKAYPFRGGRHPCRAGVIVANGMLYSQPHGCKCVSEALRGFIAFAPAVRPAKADPDRDRRLETGPAAGTAPATTPGQPAWPTFRHDPARSAATPTAVPAPLEMLWKVSLADQELPPAPLGSEWLADPLGGDRITAPVLAGPLAFVALPDAHRVVAVEAATGARKWSFTAGGRVDTPPTVHRGLCLFGCYDGWVYCLRASDGQLVWRFRAAPADRRVVAFGQVESAWPVIGGVMVAGDTAYVLAGRSSAVDGGVYGYALRPADGEVLWQKKMPIALSDLLVMEGRAFRVAGGASAGNWFDPANGRRLRGQRSGFNWEYAGKIRTLWGGPNRVLDRTWRALSIVETASWWMRIRQAYGSNIGYLAVGSPDGRRTYAFGFKHVHWSKVKNPANEFVGQLVAREGSRQLWKIDSWGHAQAEAMCLAGDALYAAGPVHRFGAEPGARLWVIAAEDGRKLAEQALPALPAAEGLAAANGRLYLATRDGQLICFGKK